MRFAIKYGRSKKDYCTIYSTGKSAAIEKFKLKYPSMAKKKLKAIPMPVSQIPDSIELTVNISIQQHGVSQGEFLKFLKLFNTEKSIPFKQLDKLLSLSARPYAITEISNMPPNIGYEHHPTIAHVNIVA